MPEQSTISRAIKWGILTTFTPLAVSLFAANFYIALWYVNMAIAETPHQGPPPLHVIQRGIIVTAWVGLWFTLLMWWFLHRKQANFSTLFKTQSNNLRRDLALGLSVGGALVVFYGILGWPTFSEMFVFDSAKLMSLPASLSAGFCEELLFRGFVICLIAKAGANARAQVGWSSIAFGLAHFHWGPVGMLFAIGLGIVFSVVTLRRGSVWAAVIAHMLLNLCVEPGLFEKALSYTRG